MKPAMTATVLGSGMTRHDREVARRDAERTSQDFPLLPTSALDASPILPEESGDRLSPQQRLAVAALVSGQSFTVAARAAGVSRRTIYSWRREAAFQRTVDDLSRDALMTTATRIRNLMLRATRVLSEGMIGPNAFGSAMRVANSAKLWAAWNAGAAELKEHDGAETGESIAGAETTGGVDEAPAMGA